jgi:hypothetical protein
VEGQWFPFDAEQCQQPTTTTTLHKKMNAMWQEPCMACGQFIAQSRCMPSGIGPIPALLAFGRRHLMRPDFKLDAKVGYDGSRMQMSHSIDALSARLADMRFNISRLMNLLVVAWWAISGHDPASASYVRVAVELKHAISNLINAIEGIVAWMTGGCVVVPVFNVSPCETYDQWAKETFSFQRSRPNTFMPLPTALDQIRGHTNHINDQVPHIYLEMIHVREEHGNDVGFLMSPAQVADRGLGGKGWLNRCDTVRSLDLLRNSLGIMGPHNPVPWALAHIRHFLGETIKLVQRDCPNVSYSDDDQ